MNRSALIALFFGLGVGLFALDLVNPLSLGPPNQLTVQNCSSQVIREVTVRLGDQSFTAQNLAHRKPVSWPLHVKSDGSFVVTGRYADGVVFSRTLSEVPLKAGMSEVTVEIDIGSNGEVSTSMTARH
jgi:hypothetical protein